MRVLQPGEGVHSLSSIMLHCSVAFICWTDLTVVVYVAIEGFHTEETAVEMLNFAISGGGDDAAS